MFRIFLFAFIALTKSFAVLQSEVNHNCDYLDQEKAFKVCWGYNETTDIVNFALEVKTLGWVGFGFAHKIHKMQNYDVIVGKIQNGKESLTDRFTTGYKEPLADLEQDYTLTGFNESNGKTFLEFHRKRDTGDSNDIEIKPGPMLLVYAYHSLDYPSPYKTKHEKQGSKIVTLIPADTGKPAPEPASRFTKNSITAHQSSQTAKLSTSAAAHASSSVKNTGSDPKNSITAYQSSQTLPTAKVSTSAAVYASSSVIGTDSDPNNSITAHQSSQTLSTAKVSTSAAVHASSSVIGSGSDPNNSITAHQSSQTIPTVSVSTSAAVLASSSANNTNSDRVPREQGPASSNAHASIYFTLVFSLCNLILTASTCCFFSV